LTGFNQQPAQYNILKQEKHHKNVLIHDSEQIKSKPPRGERDNKSGNSNKFPREILIL
jgi:hypothetical protein